VSSELYEKVMH